MVPAWISNKYNLAALLIALVLDYAYPRHRGLSLAVHPVHTSFLLARRLAPPYSSALRGALAWLAVMASHLAVAASLLYAAWRILGAPGWVVAAALVYKHSISLRLLLQHSARTASLLGSGRLGEARLEVSNIVRRDTSSLSGGHVASAAIESVAESLVDGFTSPLLYAALLGPLGALAQRVANTLDGALGFKTPEYINAGRLSAYADTVLNWIPARLTGLLIALAAPLAGGSVSGALHAMARWGASTESRNAGYPMASMAGALGVCLEKPGSYRLNPQAPCPGPGDVYRANRVAIAAAALTLLLVAALAAAV